MMRMQKNLQKRVLREEKVGGAVARVVAAATSARVAAHAGERIERG